MIPKVAGIETEYGIHVRGGESNPVLASSILINAYLKRLQRRVGWDFIGEQPEVDARGTGLREAFPPDVETHLVNAVLTNGSRYYVDHAHPEISTPECLTPLEVLIYDRAAEEIVRESIDATAGVLPEGCELLVYKNNSDGKGNSYGCHENYLVQRSVAFQDIVRGVTPHFVTRQIFCGSGKVGIENISARRGLEPNNQFDFQISQRADFFEAEVGLETTLKRPIVNTRDEPHCDPQKYRRLHVICGDANLSESATFLKVASTCVVLAMIEDGCLPEHLDLRDPIRAVQEISADPGLKQTVELRNGRRLTAFNIQELICEAAINYLRTDTGSIGESSSALLIDLWPRVLHAIDTQSEFAHQTVDWLAKHRIIRGFAERHNIVTADAKIRLLDLQYHDMRPGKSLASKAGLLTLADPNDVARAITQPPSSTRAFFRGTCLARWPESVLVANWDSLVLDIGNGESRRIAMNEPLRGSEPIVGALLAKSESPRDLIDLLERS